MKKIVFIVMLIMNVISASAQWKVTPEAGMNVTKYKGEGAKMGFKAGAAVSYTFASRWFSLQSGLYFVQRGKAQSSYAELYGTQVGEDGQRNSVNMFIYPASGASMGGWGYSGPGIGYGYGYDSGYGYGYNNSYSHGGGYGYGFNSGCVHGLDLSGFDIEGVRMYRNRENRGYIQLPVLARFNWEVGKDIRLYIAAGPYFALGVTGKEHHDVVDWKKGNFLPSDRKESWNPFSNDRSYKTPRFDWGAAVEVGVEVKRLTFKMGYDLGFGKESPYGDFDPKYHTVSFTVGYTF